jgi:hypothetical protein
VPVFKFDAIVNYRRWVAARGPLPRSAPPRGAIAFWNVTQYGHTAIGLGNGFVASTTGVDGNGTPNAVRHFGYWGGYLGWVQPA